MNETSIVSEGYLTEAKLATALQQIVGDLWVGSKYCFRDHVAGGIWPSSTVARRCRWNLTAISTIETV
jgi:hypothetical protein